MVKTGFIGRPHRRSRNEVLLHEDILYECYVVYFLNKSNRITKISFIGATFIKDDNMIILFCLS